MQYGICPINSIALRREAKDASEMVSQLLYGETFTIHESTAKWSKIRIADDGYSGWIDNNQFQTIEREDFEAIASQTNQYQADLVEFVENAKKELQPVTLGAKISSSKHLNHHYEGRTFSGKRPKAEFLNSAFLYLNSPYLWGGKTPFGIDCSGFTQMVYKLNGVHIKRDASQQAKEGEVLSFIEESEAGDLAFFDNENGKITHVGIIMADNHIIHAHGKVRIDRIDHTGILNSDTGSYSHKLRVIKKIVT